MPLHPDVKKFIQHAISGFGGRPKSVLELGSYAMHDHDPRPLFKGAKYLGLDARPGPGVDLVGLAHDLPELVPDPAFDVVLSLQALEHDPFWKSTLKAGMKALRRGGVFVVTCAGPKWKPHEYDTSPLPGYYRNVSTGEIVGALVESAAELGLEVERIQGMYPDGFLLRSSVWIKVRPHVRTDGALREETWNKLKRVESALPRNQCEALYLLATASSSGPVVEIGAYKGRSTISLALALQHAGAKLVTYDPFKDWTGPGGTRFGPHLLSDFRRNLKMMGVQDVVRHEHEVSQGAPWTGDPIKLLFIDGDHTTLGVSADWQTWGPRMDKEEGIVVLHDTQMDGPANVWREATSWSVWVQVCTLGENPEMTVLVRPSHPRLKMIKEALSCLV